MGLECPFGVIESTLASLRLAGESAHEGIVLWLGRRCDNGHIGIYEAYSPDYSAESDMFHIPRQSMAALLEHLRRSRLMIGAQVHSHPGAAFHSTADDALAIVRHIGALSFVVPRFARKTTAETFLRASAVYELDSANRWVRVPAHALRTRCRVI